MTVIDAIELFRHEMTNEIFHACTDSDLQDTLIHALDNACQTVAETYKAEKKNR